jgi:hypothetical protein
VNSEIDDLLSYIHDSLFRILKFALTFLPIRDIIALPYKAYSMLETSPDATGQNQSQRTHLALGVVALLSLVLGIWQLRTSINMPFLPNSSVTENSGDVNQPAAEQSEDIKALQNRDTDKDGLSDYDELYVYHTSAYLKDTDSDSYEDKTEIQSGNNPNCASGQTCQEIVATANSGSTFTNSLTIPSPAEIRTLLKNNGASDDVLAKYDDVTLVEIYRQVAGEASATQVDTTQTINTNSAATTSQTNQLTAEQKNLIAKMSASELREFLIQGGADKAAVDKLDDTTLRAVVNQVIGQ